MASRSTRDVPLRRVGRFTILEELARGGMAQVFVAQEDGSQKVCVLKQLLGELETHATATKRFLREANLAACLDHPRIARTINAGFEEGMFCIAMEYIPGKDVESVMHHLMRHGLRLPYQASVAIAVDALEGLAHAHEARRPDGTHLELVHRDLSPRNLMLGFDGQVRIIDFGLAHGKIDTFKTAPGTVLGTLRYISPEQAMADPIDHRSDLYSLAVVLFEMLSGRPLVPDAKPYEVLDKVVTEIPPRLSLLSPNLPPALDHVLARALKKRREERWPNANAFRTALLEAVHGDGTVQRHRLGEWLRGLFPGEEQHARDLIALGERRFAEQRADGPFGGESTQPLGAPLIEPFDRHEEIRTEVTPRPIPRKASRAQLRPVPTNEPEQAATLVQPTIDDSTRVPVPTIPATPLPRRATTQTRGRESTASTRLPPRLGTGSVLAIAIASAAGGVMATLLLMGSRPDPQPASDPLPVSAFGTPELSATPGPAGSPAMVEPPEDRAAFLAQQGSHHAPPRSVSHRQAPLEPVTRAPRPATPAPQRAARGGALSAKVQQLIQPSKGTQGFDEAAQLLAKRIASISDPGRRRRLSAQLSLAERTADGNALVGTAVELEQGGD